MGIPRWTEHRDQTRDGSLRSRLILLASGLAVLAFLHFVDHVIRGALVVNGGLDPAWNHSGWPFNNPTDKPYIFPASFVLSALLVVVHFVGFSSGTAETPNVIAMSYNDNVRSFFALAVLFGLFAGFAALAFQAVKTRQRSGHW